MLSTMYMYIFRNSYFRKLPMTSYLTNWKIVWVWIHVWRTKYNKSNFCWSSSQFSHMCQWTGIQFLTDKQTLARALRTASRYTFIPFQLNERRNSDWLLTLDLNKHKTFVVVGTFLPISNFYSRLLLSRIFQTTFAVFHRTLISFVHT